MLLRYYRTIFLRVVPIYLEIELPPTVLVSSIDLNAVKINQLWHSVQLSRSILSTAHSMVYYQAHESIPYIYLTSDMRRTATNKMLHSLTTHSSPTEQQLIYRLDFITSMIIQSDFIDCAYFLFGRGGRQHTQTQTSTLYHIHTNNYNQQSQLIYYVVYMFCMYRVYGWVYRFRCTSYE